MNDCIFCKIIAGEMQCIKVYEDEDTIAFLDLYPSNRGHTVVVPKKHCADFVSANGECLESVLATAQKVARACMTGTGASGCNISTNNGATAGQSVFHLHWHIIPRFEGDGLVMWPQAPYKEGEADQVAEQIRSAFS